MIHRVFDGKNFVDFDLAVIEKMRTLGLIRYYGKRMTDDGEVHEYRGAPRSRSVVGKGRW